MQNVLHVKMKLTKLNSQKMFNHHQQIDVQMLLKAAEKATKWNFQGQTNSFPKFHSFPNAGLDTQKVSLTLKKEQKPLINLQQAASAWPTCETS